MQKLERPKERNLGLDALRILSMLLIILLHSIDHSGVLETADAMGGMIGWYIRFLYILVQVCVNCYVLISGYFLVESKFRLQKLVALWLEVVFYSFVVRLVFIFIGYRPFSIASLISCFVPIFTGRYWFITIYFGLYLVSPFLSVLVHAMNRKQHMMLNVVLFVLMSVMVSIYPKFAGMNSGGGWGLAWFVTLYLLAAWYRCYYQPNGKCVTKILAWIGIAAAVAILYEVGEYFPPIRTIADNWYRYDSVPAYIMSLLVFVAFLNIRIKGSVIKKGIALIAPTTFGVYLIHAHADFSPWSWEALDLPQKMGGSLFPIFQLSMVCAIFIVCSVIDILRKKTVGRFENTKHLVDFCDYLTKRVGL